MKDPFDPIIRLIIRLRPENPGRFVMPYLVVVLTLVLLLNVYFVSQLRDGLVTSCEKNGNPLREAVQGMLREEIARSNSPQIKTLFPQIPAGELEHLIDKQVVADEATIYEITPVDCGAQYPPVPLIGLLGPLPLTVIRGVNRGP
jgi:hypothetical protein